MCVPEEYFIHVLKLIWFQSAYRLHLSQDVTQASANGTRKINICG